jgi:hypothetical protein
MNQPHRGYAQGLDVGRLDPKNIVDFKRKRKPMKKRFADDSAYATLTRAEYKYNRRASRGLIPDEPPDEPEERIKGSKCGTGYRLKAPDDKNYEYASDSECDEAEDTLSLRLEKLQHFHQLTSNWTEEQYASLKTLITTPNWNAEGFSTNNLFLVYMKRLSHPCRTFNTTVATNCLSPPDIGTVHQQTFKHIVIQNFSTQKPIQHFLMNSLYLCINWAMPLLAFLLYEDLDGKGLPLPTLTLVWIQVTQQRLVTFFGNQTISTKIRNAAFSPWGKLKVHGARSAYRQAVLSSAAFLKEFGVNIPDSAQRLVNLLNSIFSSGSQMMWGKIIEALKWSDRVRPSVAILAVKAQVCQELDNLYGKMTAEDIEKVGNDNINWGNIPGTGQWGFKK